MDAAGDVVDAAMAAGATRVDHVAFEFSEQRGRELRAGALEDAMDRAREQATVVAASEGLSLDAVAEVETRDGGHPRPQGQTLAAESAGGASTPFESGPVDVSAGVEVTYDAE